jgi:hypothetical protein
MIKEIKEGAGRIATELKAIQEGAGRIDAIDYVNIIEKNLPEYTKIHSSEGSWMEVISVYVNPWKNISAQDMRSVIAYGLHNLGGEHIVILENLIENIERYRLQTTVFNAFLQSVLQTEELKIHRERNTITHVINRSNVIESSELGYVITSWEKVSNTSITKEALIDAVSQMAELKRILISRKNQLLGKDKVSGLKSLYDQKPTTPASSSWFSSIYDEMPKNGLTSRTWGFELEIADAKDVRPVFGIEKGEDGSLRSYESDSDCECDCDDCCYHDCDCDHCENRNTDPEHCRGRHCANADMAEFRSVRGISRCKHYGLNKLCQNLESEDAEVNDTCGVHIHVYAADLEPKQVGHVLACYHWISKMIVTIAGREDTEYARDLSINEIKNGIKHGKISGIKMKSVNTMHLNSDRGTIEFRQMEGTLNYKKITVWAWLVRGLVTCAQRGMTLSSLIKAKNLEDVMSVMSKYQYSLSSENPDEIIPGGRQDNDFIKKHKYMILER